MACKAQHEHHDSAEAVKHQHDSAEVGSRISSSILEVFHKLPPVTYTRKWGVWWRDGQEMGEAPPWSSQLHNLILQGKLAVRDSLIRDATQVRFHLKTWTCVCEQPQWWSEIDEVDVWRLTWTELSNPLVLLLGPGTWSSGAIKNNCAKCFSNEFNKG